MRIELIQKIQEQRESKLLCYLTSDRQNVVSYIAKDILPIFAEHLTEVGYEKIDILIFTLGGDTLAAFGLNRLLREYCTNLNLLIPDKCHSAGTLFALGCDEIFMTKTSSLGPVDPNINDPLNPTINRNGQVQTIPLSVESVAGFKSLVKDEWGINQDGHLSSILKLLAEKVHPLALGNVYRSRQQIELLAMTLLQQHRSDGKNIKHIVQKLTKELGSHDYLIFRKEAQELLGGQVIVNDEIEFLIRELYKDFAAEMELGRPFNPHLFIPPLQQNTSFSNIEVVLKRAMIESEDRSDVFIDKRLLKRIAINDPQNGLPMERVQEEILFQGWEVY